MKKRKKSIPAAHQKNQSKKNHNITHGPPESFVKELINIFNANDLVLFEQKANEAIQRWPDNPIGWKALGNLYLMQDKTADALEPLSKCIELDDFDYQAHQNLGSVFLKLRRLIEAESSYRYALSLNPNYPEAQSNLGLTLLELGNLEEAVENYRKALTLKPDLALSHNNLGNALKELGHLEEAEGSYRHALSIDPDLVEAHNNLGFILFDLGRFGEAETSFRQALSLKPDSAPAYSGLGNTLLKRGQWSEAINYFRQSISLDPITVAAQDGLNKALNNLTPYWHVPMMNDRFRNDAYYNALQNAITPDTSVLEIGTGSGLLAMMAARLGARQVTTCEAVTEIAETARAIVAENGFTPPVTVVSKISTKLEIGEDMDDRADLLVSEILSSEFLGEGVLTSIEDAKRRLLKPGASIIPARGSIQFALFGGADIEQNIRVDDVYGFDLSRFNTIVAPKQIVFRNDLNIELLTDETCAFFFDFAGTKRFPSNERKIIEVPVHKAGRCCGIIQWLKLEMDDSVVFENHPSNKNPSTSWQHCVYAFPTAIDMLPGQVAVISVFHNRSTPWFLFEGMK
ncbi:MAG: protein arginine N-methyltransferase [Desulfobulbaceae bacterium]|nr:protein arginine N-methyltransferase [Desulfobulbaceae bacterium]